MIKRLSQICEKPLFIYNSIISKVQIKGIIVRLEFSNGMIISFLLWWIYFGMIDAELKYVV
jgi:hypothetical protein